MKNIILLFLLASGFSLKAQQSQLSKNNEKNGDLIVSKSPCIACTHYELAYRQYKSDKLLVKYVNAAYQCGNYNEVISVVDSNSTNAEALRLRGLSVFKKALKYNTTDEPICKQALIEAEIYLNRCTKLGYKTDGDLKEIRNLYKELFFD